MKKKQSEPYLSKYLHSRGRKLGLPISGNFELTSRCNFRCPMCYVHSDANDCSVKQQELTAEQWIEIAKQAKEQGMVFALLTGGEPFLRKDFFEIYHEMQRMGIMVSINTNGSLISGKIREQLLENPPARINISLYGGCVETYRNMCGNDAFEQVVENMRVLKEHGIAVCMNVSVTPYNYQDMEKIFEIANQLEIPARESAYMYPSIRVNGEQYGCGNRLLPKQAAACQVKWDKLRFTKEEFEMRAKNMKNFTAVEERECPVEAEAGVSCRAGSSSFWVTWDGKMLPCGMMPYPKRDILQSGFNQAWEDIKEETLKIKLSEKCVKCPKKDICGTCAAVRITETGSYEKVPAYMCEYTDALIEQTIKACQSGADKADGN